MARPTLEQQRRRIEKKQTDPTFEIKLNICKKLHKAILKARAKPENERYQYLENYLQTLIEQMY